MSSRNPKSDPHKAAADVPLRSRRRGRQRRHDHARRGPGRERRMGRRVARAERRLDVARSNTDRRGRSPRSRRRLRRRADAAAARAPVRRRRRRAGRRCRRRRPNRRSTNFRRRPAPLTLATLPLPPPGPSPFGQGSFEEPEPEFASDTPPPMRAPMGAAPPQSYGRRAAAGHGAGCRVPAVTWSPPTATTWICTCRPRPPSRLRSTPGFGFPETVDFRSGPSRWSSVVRDLRRLLMPDRDARWRRRRRREARLEVVDPRRRHQAGRRTTGTASQTGEMIEKTATRVLDAGATITRQSGRGRLVVVKGPDRGETIAVGESPLTVGSGGGSRRAALRSDHLAQAPRHRSRAGRAGAARPRLDQRLVRAGLALQRADAGFGTEVTIGQTVLKYLPDEEEVDLAPSEKESFGSLVGRDPKMRQAVPRARRRRRDRRHRADRRRDRHRQGAARRGDPPPQPAPRRPVHRLRLRRRPRRADRIGAVRPRARRVHRRGRPIARAPSRRPTAARCSSTRSASWRSAAAGAAARARQAGGAAGGRLDVHARVRARGRGDQPRPARRGRRAPIPRGPLLPRRGGAHDGAAAARAPRRHPAAGRSTSCASSAAAARWRCRARTWSACAATPGRATCASCAT